MPTKGTGRSRSFYVTGGYAALFVAFICVVLIPYLRATRAARAAIGRYEDEIVARENKSHQLSDIDRRVQLLDLQTPNFDRLVPVNQDLGPFLTELSRELEKAGMKDITVSALPATPLGKSQRLPIDVRGKGSFAQFHEFLIRLEKLQRLSSVGKLSIDADTDMNGFVNAQILLYIYNMKTGP